MRDGAMPGLSQSRLHAVIGSALLVAVAYLALSVMSGWAGMVDAVVRIGLSGIAIMLLLSLTNYCLRFVRWQAYLRALGRDVPIGPSLRIYVAGFALTTTPGKAGEAIRGIFLRRFGVPHSSAFAAFVSERLSDLFAIALLALIYLSRYPATRLAILAALAVAALLFLLGRLGVFRLIKWRPETQSRSGALVGKATSLLVDIRRCHSWPLFLFALACSLFAWSAEALALALLLDWLGFECTISFAMFTYAIAMMAGAVSMIPGGLGGTEAVMIAVLVSAKMHHGDAVAATVAIRLCTLWFAVLLGILALTAQNRRPEHVSRE